MPCLHLLQEDPQAAALVRTDAAPLPCLESLVLHPLPHFFNRDAGYPAVWPFFSRANAGSNRSRTPPQTPRGFLPACLAQVHGAFLHRRKMMKNSLPLAPEAVASALEAAGLNPSARAQDLSLDDFVRLHHLLETSGGFPEAEVGDGLARP